MTRAIELNDSGVRLAAPTGLIVASPGYAIVDARRLLIGEAALRESRLDPRHMTNNFWQRLSMDPVQHPHPSARTQADLAHAHLLHVWESAEQADGEVLFVVPGHFSREQLALLLGIVRECPFDAVGLIDAAVAAAGRAQPDGGGVLHVGASLHQSVITLLEATPDWQRRAVVDLPALGLAALRDAWINLIADAFIRETRFDPLHDAATEQRLFDRVDGWIDALADRETVEIELESGANLYRVELERSRLVDKVTARYATLMEALQRLRSRGPGSGVQRVLLGAELARLPGLPELLGTCEGLKVDVLEPDAAVRGALEHEADIRNDGEALRFITKLPRARAADGAADGPADGGPAPAEPASGPAAGAGEAPEQTAEPVGRESAEAAVTASDREAATHVLLDAVAWPLPSDAAGSLPIGGPEGIGAGRHPERLGALLRTDAGWLLATDDGRREPLAPGMARVLGPERVIISLIRVEAS